MQMAQPHLEHGGHRQRQQHAGETEELSSGQDRENHRHRMQPGASADETRREPQAVEQLSDAEHREHPQQRLRVMELYVGADAGGGDAGEETEIRHETQQAGEQADGQRQIEADDPQAGGVYRRQRQHHRELSTQEAPQHRVGFAGKRPRTRLLRCRQ